jgi:hypothetical protein
MESKTIPCNRYDEAVKELAMYKLIGFEPRTEIQEAEKNRYLCICVLATDSPDGMSKNYEAKETFCTEKKWMQMHDQIKTGMVSGVFNGMYNKVVILHNPNAKLASKAEPKKTETTKQLSPAQKKAVKEMFEVGTGAVEIANDLQIEVERVEAFIKTIQ